MHEALPVALILLASAVAVVVLFRRLSMPAILGYLIVGAAVGPNALGLVANSEDQRYIAEFGVVFLMFSVGLEFSLPQIFAMRRSVFGLGGAQVVAVIALGLAVALLAGESWRSGLVIGGVLAMSSTAIVSKMLSETMQLHTPHGRQIMSVLLFQDLAVIPLLVIVPALAFPPEALAGALGWAALKAMVVLLVVLVVGQRVMRPLFRIVANQKSSELFVLFVLLVALGLAWFTELAGLSLALGAFLAGMLISETEYRYQVDDYIMPFRDVLLGLFFVTIGMLLDVRAVLANFIFVALVLVALLAIKFVLVFFLARQFGSERPTALRTALSLAPAGEFGFVLLALAQRNNAVPSITLQVVLAGALLSMLVAPLLLQRMERIVLYFVESEWTSRAMALHQLAVKTMNTQGHVIVCGYGRSGQALAHFLESEKISVIALDSDPERVRQAAAAGDSVVYGDAARREVLIAAALVRATAVVVSFADTGKALAILSHVREMRPEVPVIVRTFDDTDVARLKEAGAAEIVAEVVEGSLMLATQTMLHTGMPFKRVLQRLRDERQERYQLMRGFFPGATDTEDEGRRLHSIVLGPSAACVGKAIGNLNLDHLGAHVTAIRRPGTGSVELADEIRLQEGDVVVLLGDQEGLARAEFRLLQG
ncbi:monovalent cation:proton antiporter family protein [Usitatibacter palustris]|uniref:Glutathione-regulated potassium-efflux system protein KefC n=1 Tax=Usitatibacter palustris TaxID=2732487 RepID=A0A6M4H3J9_9PROT|nr:monovalent cation:proton antiporter family protein [Usitatibacter palustris]QJR13283.1 Glutathione-regulated potassium-efflux system protein KefC [Usitatibacter palustris]